MNSAINTHVSTIISWAIHDMDHSSHKRHSSVRSRKIIIFATCHDFAKGSKASALGIFDFTCHKSKKIDFWWHLSPCDEKQKRLTMLWSLIFDVVTIYTLWIIHISNSARISLMTLIAVQRAVNSLNMRFLSGNEVHDFSSLSELMIYPDCLSPTINLSNASFPIEINNVLRKMKYCFWSWTNVVGWIGHWLRSTQFWQRKRADRGLTDAFYGSSKWLGLVEAFFHRFPAEIDLEPTQLEAHTELSVKRRCLCCASFDSVVSVLNIPLHSLVS
jgi:hypothetical protein